LAKLRKEKDGNVVDFGKNGYENLETITQITTKLQLDMSEFHSHYSTKYSQEDILIKKSKERDLLMMAEGKNELLKKQLNQMTMGPSKYALENHQQNTFNNNYPRAFRDKGPSEDLVGGDITVGKDPDSVYQNDPTRSATKSGSGQVTFSDEDDDDSASNELIITNGDVASSLNLEGEQKEKLKNFQTGLAERIKELEILHAAALADISIVTDPKSEIQVPTSRTRGVGSETEVRESISGIKDPRSGPGIHGTGAGRLPPGFFLENVNYDQTEFQNLSRPSNNEMERKNYFNNYMIQNIDQSGDENVRNNNNNNNNNNSSNNTRNYFNGNMNNYGHTYSNNNNNNNMRNDLNYRNNYDNKNNNTNNNNHNNNNSNNQNKKQNSPDLNQDVRSHPYAPSPYVQSLCPELVHANILTVSKGQFLTLYLCAFTSVLFLYVFLLLYIFLLFVCFSIFHITCMSVFLYVYFWS
jgi:hypothetical protein